MANGGHLGWIVVHPETILTEAWTDYPRSVAKGLPIRDDHCPPSGNRPYFNAYAWSAGAPPVALPRIERQPRHRRAGPGGPAQTRGSAPQRLPKQDQFPTPAPLTTEEHALIKLARLYPDELQAPAELRPIEIPPIEIAPLRIDEDR